MSETIQLLADQIARRMAHRWARRMGRNEERAEEVIDHAAPLVWAQQLPSVPDALGEVLAKATALVCVQKARGIAYNELVAERAALEEWAARRQPRSVFVGDDGGGVDAPPYPVGDLAPPESWLDRWSFHDDARRACNRLLGYDPLWELSAYHAG